MRVEEQSRSKIARFGANIAILAVEERSDNKIARLGVKIAIVMLKSRDLVLTNQIQDLSNNYPKS